MRTGAKSIAKQFRQRADRRTGHATLERPLPFLSHVRPVITAAQGAGLPEQSCALLCRVTCDAPHHHAANLLRSCNCQLCCDQCAELKAEQVDLPQSQPIEEVPKRAGKIGDAGS
jgi:hypothetical protein